MTTHTLPVIEEFMIFTDYIQAIHTDILAHTQINS